MVREIVKDTEKLQEKCKTVKKVKDVRELIQDLRDTAEFHEEQDNCVGLAANQVGGDKRVIIVRVHPHGNYNTEKLFWMPMINPVITNKSKTTIDSEEGCLSLEGVRTVKRYQSVEVMFTDVNGKIQRVEFYGFEACIVQHEIDHLNGKLI